MQQQKENKGITLIALIVTIIVMLILVSVTIRMLINSRLFEYTQKAGENYKISQVKEVLENARGSAEIKKERKGETEGKLTAREYLEELIEEGITDEDDITDNGDGSFEFVTDDGYVAEVYPDENGDLIIEVEGEVEHLSIKISRIDLTTTTSSIKVSIKVRRGENATYKYLYKEFNSEEDYKQDHEGAETEWEIKGLEHGKTYIVKVIGTNKSGTSEKTAITKLGLVEGAIVFDNLSWSNNQANVTISTATEYDIEYRKNEDENWEYIENGATISGLVYQDVVYARLTDGKNHNNTATYNVDDLIEPIVTIDDQVKVTTNSIEITAKATDEQSGMPEKPQYEYYIREKNGQWRQDGEGTTENTTHVFTGLTHNKEYEVQVKVADKAGNKGTGEKRYKDRTNSRWNRRRKCRNRKYRI